jgi:hypothetical protein
MSVLGGEKGSFHCSKVQTQVKHTITVPDFCWSPRASSDSRIGKPYATSWWGECDKLVASLIYPSASREGGARLGASQFSSKVWRLWEFQLLSMCSWGTMAEAVPVTSQRMTSDCPPSGRARHEKIEWNLQHEVLGSFQDRSWRKRLSLLVSKEGMIIILGYV